MLKDDAVSKLAKTIILLSMVIYSFVNAKAKFGTTSSGFSEENADTSHQGVITLSNATQGIFVPTLRPSSVTVNSNNFTSSSPASSTVHHPSGVDGLNISRKTSTVVPGRTPAVNIQIATQGILVIDSPSTMEGPKTGAGQQSASPANEKKVEAPYGTWQSPITSYVATKSFNPITEPPQLDPLTGNIFWAEQILQDGGRGVVFHFNPETNETVRWTSTDYSVRTQVHEYGGGSFVVHNNTLYFSNDADHKIYRQEGPEGRPQALTSSASRRYADGCYCEQLDSLFWVVEDHDLFEKGEAKEPENGIVMIHAKTGVETVVVAHADFFASPRVTEDGTKIAWVQWNHPEMPWGETRLFAADIQNEHGKLAITKYIQHGGMMTPSWSPANELLYVHDMTGWWNLYIINRKNAEINLTPFPQEVGWPMWHFGRQAYAANPRLGMNEIVVICGKELMIVDTVSAKSRVIDTGYTSYSIGVTYSKDGDKVYVVAGSGTEFPKLLEVNIRTDVTRPFKEQEATVDPSYISVPQQIQFITTKDDFAYGYLYLPKNPDYRAPLGTKPPLLVKAHGGPTSAALTSLNLEFQFFVSRGFVILDVDYRGSSGYGKLYRSQLNGKWGVYDVDDVVAGAQYLVKEGLVDPEKLCVDGFSAGGYTTLSVLTFRDLFKAGASYYGISDLLKLTEETHKFESRYMEYLIGSPSEDREKYLARSPIYHANELSVPTIFFQGTDDKIVPPNQAREMYDVVKNKSLPTAFVLFEGEGHGFVSQKNLQKCLEAEMIFFASVFGFTPSDVSSDVIIDNLDGWHVSKQPQKISVTIS